MIKAFPDVQEQTIDDVVVALEQMGAPPPHYVTGPLKWDMKNGVVTVNGTAFFPSDDPTLLYRGDHANAGHLPFPVWDFSRFPLNYFLNGYKALAGNPTIISPMILTPPDTKIDLAVRVFGLTEKREGHVTCDVFGAYSLNGEKLATVYAPGHMLSADTYKKIVNYNKKK